MVVDDQTTRILQAATKVGATPEGVSARWRLRDGSVVDTDDVLALAAQGGADGTPSAWEKMHHAISEALNYQGRVGQWMMKCFGADITNSAEERANRFQEESNELSQAMGMTRERAHELVDYTWDRPVGDPQQEIGGVMVTLAALCHARGYDMAADGETELARIDTPAMIDKIRRKHEAKALRTPHSALPGSID